MQFLPNTFVVNENTGEILLIIGQDSAGGIVYEDHEGQISSVSQDLPMWEEFYYNTDCTGFAWSSEDSEVLDIAKNIAFEWTTSGGQLDDKLIMLLNSLSEELFQEQEQEECPDSDLEIDLGE